MCLSGLRSLLLEAVVIAKTKRVVTVNTVAGPTLSLAVNTRCWCFTLNDTRTSVDQSMCGPTNALVTPQTTELAAVGLPLHPYHTRLKLKTTTAGRSGRYVGRGGVGARLDPSDRSPGRVGDATDHLSWPQWVYHCTRTIPG